MITTRHSVLALLLCAGLSACGGGGSTSASTSSNPASSSAASSAAVSSSAASSSANRSTTSSSSSSAAVSSAAPILSQSGNPASGEMTTYQILLSTTGDAAAKLAADMAKADVMLTWQTTEGGFYKHLTDYKNTASTSKTALYVTKWVAGSKSSTWLGVNGEDLGTIDNDATTSELFFLADVYKRSGDTKYRDAARRTLDFLLLMQYPTGGFPQVYPARSGDTPYSNYVTFNDDAMARVMLVLDQVAKKTAPLDATDLFTAEQYAKLATAIDKGVDYILKSQIVQNGVKTVWCAQHDPVSYVAREGRAYEWPSKSGKESVGVIGYLMSRPQTAEIKAAVQAGLAWFRSSAVQVANTAYVNRASGSTDITYNPIQTQAGSVMWYRFYDLDKDVGFFSGRTPNGSDCSTPAPFATCTGKQYDIMAIEAERRYGYSWGGAYASSLLSYATSVGY
ncbi:pectate lyase [Uliginosibacterium sp. TH139]|uniref:pectate lyase n=1 Tax=Uliginosibacterium sp. TH139 TaxID=2067453 RepID=UPI000C7D7FFE|nr:pectate lyase [Uliginosibacterium sp. TH139]PLK50661.1 pectate lyase [Uliginosibacterium sp. TH139]